MKHPVLPLPALMILALLGATPQASAKKQDSTKPSASATADVSKKSADTFEASVPEWASVTAHRIVFLQKEKRITTDQADELKKLLLDEVGKVKDAGDKKTSAKHGGDSRSTRLSNAQTKALAAANDAISKAEKKPEAASK